MQNDVRSRWTFFGLFFIFVGVMLRGNIEFALSEIHTGECAASGNSNMLKSHNTNINEESNINNENKNKNGDNEYEYNTKIKIENKNNRRLVPSDLPPPQFFDNFDGNTTINVADRELTVLRGSIVQHGRSQKSDVAATGHNSNSGDTHTELVVLPGLIPRSVVAEMLTLLRGHENADKAGGRTSVQLDQDPDSVDGMTSQEIFLDNDNLREGRSSSKGGILENVEERKELRRKLLAITEQYSHGILSPFMKQWYGTESCGRTGRQCTPCYSLIRRYRAGERQSHAPHNDHHSFVTVVVSLTDYGDEYTGGLYVSTQSSDRHYVKLNRGDAVAHKGELHHGVRVLDQRDDRGPSERWSWIMWFRDSDTCEDHGDEWYQSCAEKGNPACMYLMANQAKADQDKVSWNTKASNAGQAQATVKLAYAHLKALPSEVIDYNLTKAIKLFEDAILSTNEPDGHYGLAAIILHKLKYTIMTQPDNESKNREAIKALGSELMIKAITHLEEAARGGHVFAMFNLGICHTFGYSSKERETNHELASEWFEASGLPEGLFAKATYLNGIGKEDESLAYFEKARILGYGKPWRQLARENTGYGGSSATKLNMPWPPQPGGISPPQW